MATTIDDSMAARISADCPDDTKQLLYHAWAHDTSDLKKLLDVPGKASARDPATGETPLHAAIRACGPAPQSDTDNDADDTVSQEAAEAVHELFLSGAIWNDVDSNDETPGCVAWRLGRKDLYRLCLEAGVRAELLFGLFDGYEELSSGSSAEEEDVEIINVEDALPTEGEGENGVIVEKETETEKQTTEQTSANGDQDSKVPSTETATQDVTSEQYLASNLTYDPAKLVDDQGNGVMMAWETSIMRRSVDALLRQTSSPGPDNAPTTLPQGKRILNIGFGMGIIDAMFAATNPSRHHIIEAHPAVLAHIDAGNTAFGSAWEASGPGEGAYKVHRGRWQDVLPQLLEAGEQYDAIYFDTFGEDYAELKMFFTEYVPVLMDQAGRFGFFNGLGADRRICYDVYTKVVEMHMVDVGMDVEWEEIDVDLKGMEEAGKGEWEDVRRRYWTLDKYRLPICTFMSGDIC
ncbi:hypothetical protein ACRALDRAFT_2027886 [Sodiomyces alcalophilus JCM 7366]|uniref:uncharacterized protein n=1 Tax=Sodiomyces alcalophilus JCM 7366 TaxID=591952 RepID=UPI0039B56640